MRTCSICHATEEEAEFSKGKTYCKECDKKVWKKYYAAHREEILLSQHQRYALSKGIIPSIQLDTHEGSVRKLCPKCNCRVHVQKDQSVSVCPSCGASLRIIQAIGESNKNRNGIILRVEA